MFTSVGSLKLDLYHNIIFGFWNNVFFETSLIWQIRVKEKICIYVCGVLILIILLILFH